MTKHLAFSLLLTFGLTAPMWAQQRRAPLPHAFDMPLQFDHFWLNEGLSQSTVHDIEQDNLGFLWFGTNNGLNRFDGYSFTVYHAIPFDTTSLAPGFVRAIYEDHSGTLWVGTEGGGLNRMDRATGSFTHYRHDPDDTTSLSNDIVLALYEDHSGTLWVGTEGGGLNRLDQATGMFARYFDGQDRPEEVIDQGIYHLMEDPSNADVLWIASGGGLIRFDTASRSYQRYLAGTDVRDVAVDPSDGAVLWVATWGEGLVRLETRTGQMWTYRRSEEDRKGLKDNQLGRLYADRTGSIWVATLGRGVHKFDPWGGGFRHLGPFDVETTASRIVFGLCEDHMGMLWMGTADGLYRLDRQTGRYSRYEHNPGDPKGLSKGWITHVYEDRSGTLWVGTEGGGLNRMDRATGSFTPYQHDPSNPKSLSHNWVTYMYEDPSGAFWIGTADGLNRMDRATGTFARYQHNPDDTTSLGGARVLAIHEDKQGVLWVGTRRGGLNRMDRATGTFTHYQHDPANPKSLSHNGVFSIHEDASGTLWIGTHGGGLNRMDPATHTFIHYASHNSDLTTNTIYSIQEDEIGQLWLSTAAGLFRFDPANETVRAFDVEDGLPSLEFNAWAGFRSARDGEMFFGTIEGAFAFFPRWFEPNPTAPQVVLTGFKLFNRDVMAAEGSPLQQPIWETKEVRLQHDQHSIAFEYVGFHYKNPRQNRYRYRLEPFETEWVEAGSRRMASYTNLDPGEYVFRVTASNSDGIWSQEGVSVRVVIRPPWWRTIWAYSLYGLLLVAGVVAADRIQRRRLIRKEREQAHRQLEDAHMRLQETHDHLQVMQAQLIQQEKMASLGQLTAGIAHEIKNPLNFVNNFAVLSQELTQELRATLDHSTADIEDILHDLQQNAAMIAKHGRRADTIVRAMMQHASGGTGKREWMDLNTLVEEYLNLAYHGQRGQGVELEVSLERVYDEAVDKVELVPQEMGRVLVNLLNNAFEAVRERARSAEGSYRPSVEVHTRQTGNSVEIRVEDNGCGIRAEHQAKIFEPFFTTKPPGRGNTGLGLSLSYDIVTQGHGGTLTVESEDGKGATFIVTLPVSKTEPDY